MLNTNASNHAQYPPRIQWGLQPIRKNRPRANNALYEAWKREAAAHPNAIVIVESLRIRETYEDHARFLNRHFVTRLVSRTHGTPKPFMVAILQEPLWQVVADLTHKHQRDVIILNVMGDFVRQHEVVPQGNVQHIWLGSERRVLIVPHSPDPKSRLNWRRVQQLREDFQAVRVICAGDEWQAQNVADFLERRLVMPDIQVHKPIAYLPAPQIAGLLPARVPSSCVDPLIGKTVRVPGWAHRAVVESYDARGWYAIRHTFGLLNRKASEFMEVQ